MWEGKEFIQQYFTLIILPTIPCYKTMAIKETNFRAEALLPWKLVGVLPQGSPEP